MYKKCEAYCIHGGVCSLESGHKGKHSASGYCEFSDDETVDKDEADQRFMRKMAEKGFAREGESIIKTYDIL